MLEKLNFFCLTGLITLLVLMSKWMGLLFKKNHLLKCWGCLSLLNWIGLLHYLKLHYAKTASKKIGALFCSMKFLSPEVAVYLYSCTIQPCIEYCCHVWAGARSHYLKMLDKMKKQIFWTFGPSLAVSLEPLAHP